MYGTGLATSFNTSNSVATLHAQEVTLRAVRGPFGLGRTQSLLGGIAARSGRDAGPTRGAGRSNGGGPYAQRRGAPGVALRRRGNWGGTRVDLSQLSKGNPAGSRGGTGLTRTRSWGGHWTYPHLAHKRAASPLAHEVRRGSRWARSRGDSATSSPGGQCLRAQAVPESMP